LEESWRLRNSMARNPEQANLAASLNEKQSEKKEDVDATKFPAYRLKYLGSMAVDRRYTPAITLWVVREISRVQRNRPIQIDFLIEIDRLIISNAENGEIIDNIGLHSMVRLPRLKKQPKTLAFVSGGRLEADKCFCHVFACETPEAKLTLLHELKTKILKIQEESSKENSPPRSALHVPQTTKMSHRRNVSFGGVVPHTDDLVQRFSVFYVGKVTISQAKAPPKFIDEMLRYIKQKEVENKRKRSSQHDRSSVEVTGNKKHSSSGKILDLYDQPQNGSNEQTRLRSASDGDKRIPTTAPKDGKENSLLAEDNHSHHKVNEINDDVSQRVVTYQVSMSSLMLFSAGNKQLLLEKKIREISYCTKGQHRADHFGFICCDKTGFVLYLFQGESESMVDMIMKAMKQAFSDALQASAHLNLCDTCPIQILHRLCAKVEDSSLSEQQAAVQEYLQSLNETEYSYVMNKFNANQPDSEIDKITVLISLIRAMYDQRQKLHKHNFPEVGSNAKSQPHTTGETRERGPSIFEKAIKSFDNLIARKRAKTCLGADTPLSVDTNNSNKVSHDAKHCLSPSIPRAQSDEHISDRQRSRTYNSCPPTPDYQSTSQTRFVIPESAGETNVDVKKNDALRKREKEGNNGFQKRAVSRQGSWRQVFIIAHGFFNNGCGLFGRIILQRTFINYHVFDYKPPLFISRIK